MARTIRKSTDNLEQMLQDLKIGKAVMILQKYLRVTFTETNISECALSQIKKSRL